MKGKAIIPLALGLCVGIVAVKLLSDALQKARGSTEPVTTVKLVRAREDVKAFTKITPGLVEEFETTETKMFPTNEKPLTMEDLENRVTGKAIPQNAIFLSSMLAPKGTPAGMTGRIPHGFRAVSVKIDEVTGVAYQLQPGDWVDVIVVMDVEGSGRNKRHTIAEVILQNVQVAAIGRTMTGKESGQGNIKPAKSATLLVAVRDVAKLHLASTRGKITLSMRGQGDEADFVANTANDHDLYNNGEEPPKPVETAQTTTPIPNPRMNRVAHRQMEPDPVGMAIYTTSKKTGQTTVEQRTFAGPDSRRIVGVGSGPVSRVAPSQNGVTRSPGKNTFQPGGGEEASGDFRKQNENSDN